MFYLLAITMAATDGLKHVLTKISGEKISVSITNFIWTIAALVVFGLTVVMFGFQGIDERTTYVLIANALLIAISMFFYVEGLKLTDISLAVPMLSISPIITSFVNFVINGEVLTYLNLSGIFLVIIGIYLLYDHRSPLAFFRTLGQNRGAMLVLVTSCIWGIAAALDKYIVLRTNPQSYLFLINIALLAIFAAAVLVRNSSINELRKNLNDHDIRPEGMPFITGVVDAIAILIQMFLFTIYNPAQVIAVKRTSLLFGELFAAGLLKEKLAGRLLPTVIIVAGAVLSLI